MNGMTVKQAAEHLGVGERRVLYLIRDRRLSARRFGERTWMLDEKSVENYEPRPVGRPRKSERATGRVDTSTGLPA